LQVDPIFQLINWW